MTKVKIEIILDGMEEDMADVMDSFLCDTLALVDYHPVRVTIESIEEE